MENMMKFQKILIVLFVLVILLSSFQVISTSAQEEGEQGVSSTERDVYKPTFGVEINRSWYPATYDAVLNKAKDANNHWLRYNGLLWSDVQPNSSSDWAWGNLAEIDADIEAASAAGMEVILIVRSTPLWAQKYSIANGGDANYFCGPMMEANFADFANFMVKVVERYSQPPFNVQYFELWNEPDESRENKPPIGVVSPDGMFGCWGEKSDRDFFGGRHYGNMLKAVYPAVKAAVPEAQIVLGGLLLPCKPGSFGGWAYCDMSNFFKGILVEAGGQFDYANFHGYSVYNPQFSSGILMERLDEWWADSGGMVVGKFNYLQQVMGSYGVSKPILCTEVALADFNNLAVNTIENPLAVETFEAAKADYLLWVFARNIEIGIRGSTWYHMDNHGWFKSGLLDRNNRPLPAYRAFQVMTTTLGGADYYQKLNLGSGILGYEFRKGGYRIWVLFSEDSGTKTINRSAIPFTPGHVYNLLGGGVSQTATTISFNRPIYIDNIPNTPPRFISTPVTEVDQHQFYYYHVETASVAPAHFDVHTITPITLPSWLTLIDKGDGTATLSGTPSNEQLVNKSHDVVIRVTDSLGAIADQSFSIWVNNVNDAPRFISRPDVFPQAGELYVYNIEATDSDYIRGEESLTISVITKPGWLSFETDPYDGSSGIWTARLSGTPSQAQIDARPLIRLLVTDNEGLSTEQRFRIGIGTTYLPLILK
jgi:hypothetical protein